MTLDATATSNNSIHHQTGSGPIDGAPAKEVAKLPWLSKEAALTAENRVYDNPHFYMHNRPKKVVKRISRTIFSDGTESIKIEFLLSEREVDRVEAQQIRQTQERHERRHLTAFSEPSAKVAAILNAGNAVATDSNDEVYHENNTVYADSNTMSFNVNKMRQAVDSQNNFGTGSAKLTAAKGRSTSNSAASGYGMDDDESEIVKRMRTTKRSNTAEYYQHSRIPRVSFAAKLEKELYVLWDSRDAEYFRFPVDLQNYPNYLSLVSTPISLNDIRHKIVRYEYETIEQFKADFALIVINSEKFNGRDHAVTKKAQNLYSNLLGSLEHDSKIFGVQNDPFRKLEELVRRKKSHN